MSDEPRDDLDRALAARLGAFEPERDDAAAVLEEMRPGFRRARTRHRATRVATVVGALAIVVAVVAGVSSASTRHGRVAVNSAPTTSTRPAVIPQPKFPPTHDITTTTQPNAAAPSTTAPLGHPPQGSVATIPVVPSQPNPGHNGGGPAPTTTPPTQPLIYRATGGSVTLTCTSGRLALVSYAAQPGWTAENHKDESQEIEIRFSKQSDDGGISDGVSVVRTSGDDQSSVDVKVGAGGCAHLEVETQ